MDLPLYSLQNFLLQSCAFYKELPSKQKNRPNKESHSWFYRTSGSFFYQYVVYMNKGRFSDSKTSIFIEKQTSKAKIYFHGHVSFIEEYMYMYNVQVLLYVIQLGCANLTSTAPTE